MSAGPSFDALVAGSGLPRLEARALLEHASGRSREWLIAHGDEAACPATADAFAALAQQRRQGEPLAYLVGWREFHGHRFVVGKGLLIPRADTEVAVRWAIDTAPAHGRMLDLGTGTGAIAISVALERPDLDVLATDLSEQALDCAQRNARHLGAASVSFRLGHWYAALAGQERFDLIVSNPPYLASDDPHLGIGDLRFEPALALTDDADGLSALRAIIDGAQGHLKDAGWLGVEHGWQQGAPVRALMHAAGFGKVTTLHDGEARERFTVGQGPSRPHDLASQGARRVF